MKKIILLTALISISSAHAVDSFARTISLASLGGAVFAGFRAGDNLLKEAAGFLGHIGMRVSRQELRNILHNHLETFKQNATRAARNKTLCNYLLQIPSTVYNNYPETVKYTGLATALLMTSHLFWKYSNQQPVVIILHEKDSSQKEKRT